MSRGRGVVQVVIHLLAELFIFVRLGLLHPEEHPLVAGFELENKDSASGAGRDSLELNIIREDDQVILDGPGGAVLPLEMHELVITLNTNYIISSNIIKTLFDLTCKTVSMPFLLSGLTILVDKLRFIFPALNSTNPLDALLAAVGPNRAPPTAIVLSSISEKEKYHSYLECK